MRKHPRFALFAVLTLCIAASVGFGAEAGTPQSAAAPAVQESVVAQATPVPAGDTIREQRLEERKAELRSLVDSRKAEVAARMAATATTATLTAQPGAPKTAARLTSATQPATATTAPAK